MRVSFFVCLFLLSGVSGAQGVYPFSMMKEWIQETVNSVLQDSLSEELQQMAEMARNLKDVQNLQSVFASDLVNFQKSDAQIQEHVNTAVRQITLKIDDLTQDQQAKFNQFQARLDTNDEADLSFKNTVSVNIENVNAQLLNRIDQMGLRSTIDEDAKDREIKQLKTQIEQMKSALAQLTELQQALEQVAAMQKTLTQVETDMKTDVEAKAPKSELQHIEEQVVELEAIVSPHAQQSQVVYSEPKYVAEEPYDPPAAPAKRPFQRPRPATASHLKKNVIDEEPVNNL